MDIIKYIDVKKGIVSDVICDCCGLSCVVSEGFDSNGDEYKTFEYMKLSAEWGYYSNKDLQDWSAHICEKCVDEKLSFIKFDIKYTNRW